MLRNDTPIAVRLAAEQLGDHVATWRKLQRLTMQQVADRAGITRTTLRRLESGQTSVGFEVVLRVVRVLGQLDTLTQALDPYESDLVSMTVEN